MTTKISITELRSILPNPSTDRREIEKFLVIDPERSRAFSPAFTFNAETVDLEALNADEEAQEQLAFDFAIKIERTNRKREFEKRIQEDPKRPLLYAEGDSWFQFPFFISELIDYLGKDLLIYDTSKAGDTLKNMVGSPNPEYLHVLADLIHLRGLNVRGFTFSGAGNDVIGSDEHNTSYLQSMVKDYNSSQTLEWHLDTDATRERLGYIEASYKTLFDSIETRFPVLTYPDLKVFIHGYDYVQVKSLPQSNPNRPFWAADWTGEPLRAHHFPSNAIGTQLISILIDRLNEITKRVCSESPRGVYVDLRGSVQPTQWADELHANDIGFKNAARRFLDVIRNNGI